MELPTKYDAFYSAKHDSTLGHLIYEDIHGKEVKVTCVCEYGKILTEYSWPDTQYVGVVTKFVRSNTLLSDLFNEDDYYCEREGGEY